MESIKEAFGAMWLGMSRILLFPRYLAGCSARINTNIQISRVFYCKTHWTHLILIYQRHAVLRPH